MTAWTLHILFWSRDVESFLAVMSPEKSFSFFLNFSVLSELCSIWLQGQILFIWPDEIANIPEYLFQKSILFWIKGGNKPVNNNTLLLFLLETSMECPEPVSGETVESVVLFSMAKCQPWTETLTAFVCVERPWTSLACVLINSLLVIPSGAACWDSSQVPPPILRLVPSVSLFLNMASELHSSFKALTEASSFFSSRWRADYMCTCVQMRLRQLKQLSYFCQ